MRDPDFPRASATPELAIGPAAAPGGARTTSSGRRRVSVIHAYEEVPPRLVRAHIRSVQPQQELFDHVPGALDRGLPRLDAEANLLEHAAGGGMVHGHACKERPLVHLGEELS